MPFRWFRVKDDAKESLRHQIYVFTTIWFNYDKFVVPVIILVILSVRFDKKPSYLARFLFIYPLFCFSRVFSLQVPPNGGKLFSSSASVSDNALSFASVTSWVCWKSRGSLIPQLEVR